jgi:hypothetical protein
MITILADHNIEGHAVTLLGILAKAGWLDLVPLRMVTFADVGLAYTSNDRQFVKLLLVSVGIDVFKGLAVFADDPIDASDFVGCGRERLLGTEAAFETAIESAQGGVGLNDRWSSESKRLRCAVVGLVGFGTEDSAARNVIVRGETEPGGEVFGCRPSGHVNADFSENGLGHRIREAINGDEIEARDTCEEWQPG